MFILKRPFFTFITPKQEPPNGIPSPFNFWFIIYHTLQVSYRSTLVNPFILHRDSKFQAKVASIEVLNPSFHAIETLNTTFGHNFNRN